MLKTLRTPDGKGREKLLLEDRNQSTERVLLCHILQISGPQERVQTQRRATAKQRVIPAPWSGHAATEKRRLEGVVEEDREEVKLEQASSEMVIDT